MTTNEEILKVAREAGLPDVKENEVGYLWAGQLEAFYKLAYEAGRTVENAACAKLCEDYVADTFSDADFYGGEFAAVIRERVTK